MKETTDLTAFLAMEAMMRSNMRTIRGQQAMLASDVAKMYEVPKGYLSRRVKTNLDRFPNDFMIRLTKKERSAFPGEALPWAFTEAGILMAGGLLNSERAIKVHIQFINYFVHLLDEATNYEILLQYLEDKEPEAQQLFEFLKRMKK